MISHPTYRLSQVIAALLVATAATAQAQFQEQAASAGFEAPPVLDAATILRPVFTQGWNFQVSPEVVTYSGHNLYTITSDFGTFDATGNTELAARVQEIEAIAHLRAVSRTDQYKRALEKAAQGPVHLARELVSHPVKIVTGVPKGVWKFINRAGQAVKEAGEERERSPYEQRAGADLIGFSKAKRALALQLGVDPYTSNELLQKELNGIAWASYAGSMTLNLALAPVDCGAGNVITGINVAQTTSGAWRDQSPSDLRRLGLGRLLEMRVPREEATALLNNSAWSPTNQTLLIKALASLPGVEGRSEFIRLASDSVDETDTLFFRRTAELLAKVNGETPLERIFTSHGFPVCRAKDGSAILALEWDYACWTQSAAAFVDNFQKIDLGGAKSAAHRILITGVASPRAKEELATRKIALV